MPISFGGNKRSSVFRGFDLSKRALASRTTYAKVVYYHYKKQNFGLPTNLRDDLKSFTDVEVGVIDNDILKLSVSKSVQSPSGTFEIALSPSKNWKSVLAPGDWVMIYLYNNFQPEGIPTTTKNCVLVGSIDRISRSLQREDEDSDKVELSFRVSGRNFGKVFEDNDVWFDPYVNAGEERGLDVLLRDKGLELVGTPTQLTKNLIDIFLGKGGFDATKAKTSDLKPWRIPSPLAAKLGSSATGDVSFYDVLSQEVSNSVGYKQQELLTLESNGSLWDMIRRNSNNLINEVYVEEVRQADGTMKPTFVLKPRPIQTPFLYDLQEKSKVSGDSVLFALKDNWQTLQDLSVSNYVEISPAEIKYEDLGKDDHSRMNMFWFRAPQNFGANISHMANLGDTKDISNPVFIRESIQRHGLKKMDQLIEFCYAQGIGPSGSVEIDLWKAFMIQLYDMHFANHLYDAGTISCTGVLEAEIGKALVVKASNPKSKDKVYYIEGYQHDWNFQEGWTTMFTLTHGQWKSSGVSDKKIFIDASAEDMGYPDSLLQTTYVAQTGVKR